MRTRVSCQGTQVLRRRIARNLTTCAHDESRTCLTMTFRNGFSYCLRRSTAHDRYRIQITEQDLVRAHLRTGFADWGTRIEVHDVAAEPADGFQDASSVAADVQPHLRAKRMNAVHHSLLVRPYKLLVNLRPNQGSSRV